jgi:polyribonucleotide 5'-hydroxyl-kinase
VKVLNGTAEKDGVELAPRNAYTFRSTKSRILTWHGCELQIEGSCTEHVAEYAGLVDNPANAVLNLHAELKDMRVEAASERREGPRVLIAGPSSAGKSTVARTLASYATKQGHQPIVVNMDPQEGMLTLPGSLSAAVFATIMDPESSDGWGSTPTSGPSSVPVKLPLVFHYGREYAEEETEFYRRLTARMATAVSTRLSEDPDVKTSGIIVDTMGVAEGRKEGVDLLVHIADELSGMLAGGTLEQQEAMLIEGPVNVIVVVGSDGVYGELSRRFASEETSLGEPVHVIHLDKSGGVITRDATYMQRTREAAIKEYFFGDVRRALSPQIQPVDFGSLVIYKLSDCMNPIRALLIDLCKILD